MDISPKTTKMPGFYSKHCSKASTVSTHPQERWLFPTPPAQVSCFFCFFIGHSSDLFFCFVFFIGHSSEFFCFCFFYWPLKWVVETKKFHVFPPNSLVMVNYKTYHLKHYIAFVKIRPPSGKITYLISPYRAKKNRSLYIGVPKPIRRKIQNQCIAMEKDLAQSNIPVKRKIPKTIRKCQISEKWKRSPLLVANFRSNASGA